uniref:WAP domain-containing protein n=1 Tax=Rhodnius prolixus TaxID=13249 RepID=T1HKQ7_RHOPR
MPQHPFVWVLLWCSVAESLYKNVLNAYYDSNDALEGDCPALNGEISKNACLAETCTSDLDCGTKAMCCSNGCVLTCIEVDPPKGVFRYHAKVSVKFIAFEIIIIKKLFLFEAFDWTEERAELRTAVSAE